MKNLKISIQLMMLVGCLMAAFSIATFFQIQASANAIYHERYEMLRTQTETALSVLKRFHDAEEGWLPVLKQVLAAERKCDLGELLWARDVPVGGSVALEGRVRCLDGREFDFSRPRPHMRFEVRLCLPTVC